MCQTRVFASGTILVLLLSWSASADLQPVDNFEDSDPAFTRSTIDNQVPNGVLGGFWDTRANESGQAKLETRDDSQMLSVETVSFGDGRGCAFGGLSNVIEDTETGVLFFRFLMASNTDNPVGMYVGLHDKPVDDMEPLSPAAATNANNIDQIVAGFALYRNATSADDPYDVTTLDRSVILKADLVREQWYNAWIVADNSTDTFDVYISQAPGPVGAATLPAGGDKVATGLPFNRATTDALTGGAFFNSLVPAEQNGDGVRAPKAYVDEIWWDGDRGLGSLVLASHPRPADGAGDVLQSDLLLQWGPGDFAHTHNVYVGTSFDDVNDAEPISHDGVTLFEGWDVNSLALDDVGYGQTTYWRVDEVNAPLDAMVFKGAVWQFTVEPYAFDLTPMDASASSVLSEQSGPLKTIDSSGLDADGLHSSSLEDMWSSTVGDPVPVLTYTFDAPYMLHELRIWNGNANGEAVLGIGVKDLMIETSLDGTTWDSLGEFVVPQGTGQAVLAAGPPLDLAGVLAQYVRLNIKSNWKGLVDQYSVSEVKFSYVPVRAFGEQPPSGSEGIEPGTVLTWRAGREAQVHEVSIGTDAANVSLTDTVDRTQFDTAVLDMPLGQTYYWRVDEVNEAGTTPVWEGQTWAFTTQTYRSIEDFESYGRTEEDNPVWLTWLDGYAASLENAAVITGSVAGFLAPPYVDLRVTYDGSGQSMPIQFNNTGAFANGFAPNVTYSEVTREISQEQQDWTAGGAQAVFLAWRGDTYTDAEIADLIKVAPTDTDTVYVVVEDSDGQQAVAVWAGPVTDLMDPIWHEWTLPFSELAGVNLSRVANLYVGVGRRDNPAAGGMGTIWIDEIRVTVP